MKTGLYKLSLLATTLALAAPFACADISVGDGTAASATAGTNLPELVLVIWDQAAKVSYTKDLGVLAYSDYYAKGDTGKNLFVYGQQDAGFQKLFPALNSDPNFTAFNNAVMAVKQPLNQAQTANQFWGVLGVQVSADIIVGAGSQTLFTTLNTGTLPTGTRNPNYTDLVGLDTNNQPTTAGTHFDNSELQSTAGNVQNFFGNLNSPAASASTYNTHQCALTPRNCSAANATLTDGSSFDTQSSLGYAGQLFSGQGALVSNGHANVLNPVGKSSWFYMATVSSDVSDARLAVDEFDNTKHDAYWGLGVDSNGNYILSYTLEAALTPTATPAGALLRLRTDYAASYGQARLISVPNDLALNTTVTAVPEPATWGLMGLGLAVLGLRARRRA